MRHAFKIFPVYSVSHALIIAMRISVLANEPIVTFCLLCAYRVWRMLCWLGIKQDQIPPVVILPVRDPKRPVMPFIACDPDTGEVF